MANGSSVYFGDADAASFTGAGISTTTAASSVSALGLSQDRRILNVVNFSNGTVYVARKRLGAATPVVFDAIPATSASRWDLKAGNHGFSKGDGIYLYAVSAPTGDVFISAL